MTRPPERLRLFLGDRVTGIPDGRSDAGWVQVADGRVVSAGRGRPPASPDVHVPGLMAPGLIDAQANGGFGVDFASADAEEVRQLARELLGTGVTAVVPTFITAPLDQTVRDVETFAVSRAASNSAGDAAHLLPPHLEGPFLSPRRRGAHREQLLLEPTAEAIDQLAAIAGEISYVTLAPELPGALAAISRLRALSVRVSLGHSDATAAQTRAACDAGATLVTHLFNAQRPLHHREVGITGTALSDHRLYAGVIADGHHVAEEMIALAFRAAPGRVMLVTDAMAALCMAPGDYELGGEHVSVLEGEPPRRRDGTIAGAAEALDRCVGRAVGAGVPLDEAVAAATRVPAAALGISDRGSFVPGAVADIISIDPRTFQTQAVWIAGIMAHSA
jgi:N-acetylglucosamine-6-phosphate deacetylase